MKTKVDENTTPETIIAEAMVGAGAPLMHSRVEEAVAGALRKAGMLVERSEQVCAWCPSSARGSAWHNDGKLHPSCGQIDHGQGWVPEYPVDVLMSVRVERDAALAAIERVRARLGDILPDWADSGVIAVADILAALDGAPEVLPVVSQINALLGISLWDAKSFRAEIRIDFDERGNLLRAALLDGAPEPEEKQ